MRIGTDFTWVWQEPTLVSDQTPDSNDCGWELFSGSLQHSLLKQLFPKKSVQFLPLPRASFPVACMLHQTSLLKGKIIATQIATDWPARLQSYTAKIVQSFPGPVAVVDVDLLSQRAISTELLQGHYAHRVSYFEPLDSRRLLFQQLDPKATLKCYGENDHGLLHGLWGETFAGGLSPSPDTLLYPSGLLPYLEAVCGDAAAPYWVNQSNTHLNLVQFIIKFLADTTSKSTLIVALPSLVTAIGAELTKLADEIDQLVEAKKLNRVTLISDAKAKPAEPPLAIARMTSKSHGDLSYYPDFYAKYLFEMKEKSPLTWNELAATALTEALKHAEERYESWTKLSATAAQRTNLFRFVNRLTVEAERTFPRTFDLLLAAAAVIDSNFATELRKECVEAFSDFNATLPPLDLKLESLFPHVQSFSIQRFETLQQAKTKWRGVRPIQTAKQKKTVTPVDESQYQDNAWIHEDHPYSCSFPEEDIFMESYAFALRNKANTDIRGKNVMVRELQSSLGDGLDLRETLRNWHKQKIYVKEEINAGKADVGAVIFVFSDPAEDEQYSWRSFWLAEAHDNSNLMFYATPFQQQLIGPGIAKSEFGGFAVIPIPSYSSNLWHEPFIMQHAECFADAVLLAGALATEFRAVLYIAKHPPNPKITTLLKRSGRAVIFQSLDELPSDKVRSIRTFHILAEAGVRHYAQKYIRKD